MTKTIKARRANTAKQVGKHLTLNRVVNNDQQQFAFAISDDGYQVYIPAVVVKRANMQPEDIGAGFSCPVTLNPRVDDTKVQHVARLPVTWDGEPEDVEVEDAQSDQDWDDLIEALGAITDHKDDLADCLSIFGGSILKQQKIIEEQQAVMKRMMVILAQVRYGEQVIDRVDPE